MYIFYFDMYILYFIFISILVYFVVLFYCKMPYAAVTTTISQFGINKVLSIYLSIKLTLY